MTELGHSEKLARTLIVAAFKVTLPSVSTRVEGIADIADAISERSGNWRSRNTLRRRLEDATDLLTERLAALEAVEFRQLLPAEQGLAIEGICRAIDTLEISRVTIIKQGLEFHKLLQQLQPEAERQWRASLLGEPAVEYGHRFLTEACRYLINLVHDLPDFAGDVALENLLLTQKIYDLLERGIESVILPYNHSAQSYDDAAFAASYLSRIIHYCQYMQLFGTELPPELTQQPIDIAYITLMASAPASPGQPPMPMPSSALGEPDEPTAPGEQAAPGTLRVDAAIGRLLAELQDTGSQTAAERFAAVSDAAKSRTGLRILLVGSAGSGKTTVGQWLATRTAESTFEGALRPLNDATPFIVQLRTTFSDDSRPGPDETELIKFSRMDTSKAPHQWTESLLAGGKALVIFDGLDEISGDDRKNFYLWLEQLMRDYPKAHFMVTTRPEAGAAGWFESRKFSLLELQPLNLADVHRCVDAWFRAVMETAQPARRSFYRRRKEVLAREVNTRAAIQRLAATPLLAAMLCAFYANKLSDTPPRTRRELYKSVTDALIDRRERGRHSLTADQLEMGLDAKRAILQAIARYMTDAGIASISSYDESDLAWGKTDERFAALTGTTARHMDPVPSAYASALSLTVKCLEDLPMSQVSPSDALKIVLSRSTVFREVAPNEAQFIHRSIQEYLTALEYSEDGSIDRLLGHVGDAAWDNVIAFVSGMLPTPNMNALMTRILDIAGNDRRLILLAAECLASGRKIDGQISARCRAALRTILPPRNMTEAEFLAGGGEGVVSWLASYDPESADIAAACVRAASLVGGPVALDVLRRISRGPWSQAVLEDLAACWLTFDPKEYAQSVLSSLGLSKATLKLVEPEAIENVRYVRHVRSIKLEAGGWHGSLESLGELPHLEELDAGSGDYFVSLASPAGLPRLRRLNLTGTASLREVAGLHEISALEEVHLAGCSHVVDIGSLAGLTQLKVLYLDNCAQVQDWSFLSTLPGLWTLSVNSCRLDSLEFLSGMSELRTLRALVNGGVGDTRALRHCVMLRRLELRLRKTGRDPLCLPEGDMLRTLKLVGGVRGDDLAAIASCRSLLKLLVDGFSGLSDLRSLSGQVQLRHLTLRRGDGLTTCTGLEACTDLQEIDLSETLVEDLAALEPLSKLRRVVLNECYRLRDVRALAALPLLEYVSMRGVPNVDPDVLRRSTVSRVGLVVEHDPFTAAGQAAS
jgi:NACHT domain